MSVLDPAEIYRQEASELLDSLEGTLLDLGQTPEDRDLIDAAFRALHTIKGSGAMFGFDQVAAFTHDFETAFDLVRHSHVPASKDLISVALAAKDHIRALIEAPESADVVIGEAILSNLRGLVGLAGRIGAAVVIPPAEPAPGTAAADPATGWRLRIGFAPGALRNGTDPLGLLDELRSLGACTVTVLTDSLPDLEALDPQEIHLGWSVVIEGACSRQAIEDVFIFTLDDMTLEMLPLSAPAAAPGLALPPAPPAAAPSAGIETASRDHLSVGGGTLIDADRREPGRRAEKTSGSVRVQAERLDELMDRVGELVIAQARLSQLAHARSDSVISAIAEEIERLASGLRDITMGIRMVPIGTLFARFRRLIHDLSRDLGKPVEFVTSGEDTELDKTMIERLADPLVHLIRNAIDHGIEMPDRRASTGKVSTGRIELLAEHVGAQVQITVRDDGGGLDAARIRAKAEEQGLTTPGAVLSESEVNDFLFHPGFSTAQTVSTLSGRGVGMDVVKRTIEALRGSIDLTTVRGAGSTVRLRLPLTLAIIEGLLIRVGHARYIIPLSAIEECVELPRDHDDRTRGRSFLNMRGDLVPFLRLRELFGATEEPDAHQKIIVTRVGEARVGLVADGIIGNHQTVIKSLSKLHSDVTLFSGATILGDGTAALILDVAQLVAAGQTRVDAEPQARAA